MRRAIWCAVLMGGVSAAGLVCLAQNEVPHKLMPGKMAKTATVDPRFLSYNIEMVEVTGGRFWAPYRATDAQRRRHGQTRIKPAGIDPSLFRYRKPIDLEMCDCAGLRLRWVLPICG